MRKKLSILTALAFLLFSTGAAVRSATVPPGSQASVSSVSAGVSSGSSLEMLQGGFSVNCAVFFAGVGLGLLAGAALTGGIALGIAGAYLPALAAFC